MGAVINPKQGALTQAVLGSEKARVRVLGMKIRAQLNPSRAATGHMPFSDHRTCAQWANTRSGKGVDREPTTAEREKEAKAGSAKLRDAIKRIAA